MANKPDDVVNLQLTVAQVGCYEFVALRKNSARPNFRPPLKSSGNSAAQLRKQASAVSPMMPESVNSKDSGDFIFPSAVHEEFTVERLHKLRSRWSATLCKLFSYIQHLIINLQLSIRTLLKLLQ